MSESSTDAAAAAPSSNPMDNTNSRRADSIAAIMKATGPVVTCVLLQHIRPTGRDVMPHPVVGPEMKVAESVILAELQGEDHRKPPPSSSVLPCTGATTEAAEDKVDGTTTTSIAADDNPTTTQEQQPPVHIPKRHREVLTELIREVQVDTTPGKNGVQEALGGGSFTFIGQYPDEGIVLMARADQFADLDEIDQLSVRELKALIRSNPDIRTDGSTLLEKSDLIVAIKEAQLPLNPHKLQPPFDECAVRGDILLMRVASTPDDDNDDENDDESNNDKDHDDPEAAMNKAIEDFTSATAVPNDDFFLNYTMEEYLAFASRTDVVATYNEDDDDDDDEDDDENDDHGDEDDEDEEGEEEENGEHVDKDGEFDADDMLDEDDEDDKRVLLNLILGEVIKSFREKNDRGPNSEELLDLRCQVADKLGLELAPPAPTTPDRKRAAKTPLSSSPQKRVKFSPDLTHREHDIDETDNHGHEEEEDEDDDRKVAAIPDDARRISHDGISDGVVQNGDRNEEDTSKIEFNDTHET